jgi:GTP cyclohydrolase I
MRRTKFKAIKCEICGKKLLKITSSHLWYKHKITLDEYREKYPNAPMDAVGLAKSRVYYLKDKTYEEICGEKRAKKLKEDRSKATTRQMQDPKQIKRRQEITYQHTEETKEYLRSLKPKKPWYNYRKRALEYYGLECQRCGKSTENPKDFVVHHKDLNNITSELGNHDITNLIVLCKSCHAKLHNALSITTKGWSGISLVEKGVHLILKGLKNELGLNLKDENFKDTPKRVARAYAEIFSGVKGTRQQINEILESAFPCEFDSMVVASDIEVFSMCPHHLLPVHYKISAAYIPSKEHGKVIGISKLSRIVEILAKRPVLQEQLSIDITKALMRLKGCKGAAAVVDGVHYCMVMRGVKQTLSHTKTSSVRGEFNINASTRSEFMHLITDKK